MTIMPHLSDLTFSLSYGPGDDRLHAFYIPALAASTRYDRMTGYFSSHALAIAAAGVAHLIANGGAMRLLVGAQLSREDVAAIEAGQDLQATVAARCTLPDPDAIAAKYLRERLAALAWLVAMERLDIRVVLPARGGMPIPAPEARDYFHPKIGIFTDTAGEQVAFSGSINESSTGWQHNYEQFMVFTSWGAGAIYVAEAMGRFERLWEHREPDWLSLPVPDAARQQLLRYQPGTVPQRDPLEKTPGTIKENVTRLVFSGEFARERVLCQFLRDAPRLVGAEGLGATTGAVAPWPHQTAVAQQVVRSFPARYLFCDEVGLGKTIEAGLVLRELWLRGTVKRALILAPKSVLRQWQEELHEKFALDAPLYDGKAFHTLDGAEHPLTTENPWDSVTLALASSQLVKRRDRQATLLAAQPWDLVLVDEAHHARRKDFLNLSTYRPNRLLELLNALQERADGLLLMTATPMQVHPIEVWDLLNLLGLSGAWGADGRNFLHFYQQLRGESPDWNFVLRMFRSELDARGGQMESKIEARAREALGPVDWATARRVLLGDERHPAARLRRLAPAVRRTVEDVVKEHTPLGRLVFRNTRPLLRDYVKRGLLDERVPHREPLLVWIAMGEEERELYLRIEDYISNFYRKYEEQRKGLGFVMTVYRRRLTSSLYAVRCSLERRLAFLKGQAGVPFDDDDLEQEVLSLDVDEETLTDRADYAREEIAYVEDFLHALRAMSAYDSKVTRLLADLDAAFRERDTALVFTAYTDTMDFLREHLRQKYGPQVACYSGRGGEWWDGNAWVPIGKEELKNAFREGERIKILLATEAASEGLNLQTCGVLINYDMPWNPMRVEQRIGRVDRIGQRYPRVWIYNYFYEETVEAKIYQALNTRIDWFQDVVGPLQPILARVGRAIQRVALTTADEREQVFADEVGELEVALNAQADALDLDAWSAQAEIGGGWSPPVTLPELEALLTTLPTLRESFRPHESIAGAFWLTLAGEETAVTLNRAVFDAHPYTLRLLTPGAPLFDAVLAQVPAPQAGDTEKAGVRRVVVASPLPRVAYYALESGVPRRLDRLADVQQALAASAGSAWDEAALAAAHSEADAATQAEAERITAARSRLHRAQRDALLARAERLLLDAALIELALGQQSHLLEPTSYPQAFNEKAVTGLTRHGYPWAGLVRLVCQHVPVRSPAPTNAFFIQIQTESPEQLRGRFEGLRRRAERLLVEIAPLLET